MVICYYEMSRQVIGYYKTCIFFFNSECNAFVTSLSRVANVEVYFSNRSFEIELIIERL